MVSLSSLHLATPLMGSGQTDSLKETRLCSDHGEADSGLASDKIVVVIVVFMPPDD